MGIQIKQFDESYTKLIVGLNKILGEFGEIKEAIPYVDTNILEKIISELKTYEHFRMSSILERVKEDYGSLFLLIGQKKLISVGGVEINIRDVKISLPVAFYELILSRPDGTTLLIRVYRDGSLDVIDGTPWEILKLLGKGYEIKKVRDPYDLNEFKSYAEKMESEYPEVRERGLLKRFLGLLLKE